MHIIGLTGGIACGKSTVSSILKSKGLPIIDADLIAREVVLPGTKGYEAVVKVFGKDVLQDKTLGNPIDRDALAKIVFSDEGKRKKLNGIVHKLVFWNMLYQLAIYFLKGYPFVVIDVPLLIESGMHKLARTVLVVAATESAQIERLKKRDGFTQEAALARMKAQMPTKEKEKYATYVIENNGGLDQLQQTVDQVCNKIGINEPHYFTLRNILFVGTVILIGSYLIFRWQ